MLIALQDTFKETPTDASGKADLPECLQNVSPETPVMMYCTGGIRCDIYSTYLRKRVRAFSLCVHDYICHFSNIDGGHMLTSSTVQGFNNLFTLEKGIQNYLKQKGSDMWKGSLFVFDARMAVAPGTSHRS